jgi:hypothetical protein
MYSHSHHGFSPVVELRQLSLTVLTVFRCRFISIMNICGWVRKENSLDLPMADHFSTSRMVNVAPGTTDSCSGCG